MRNIRKAGDNLPREILIFPMKPHREHAFGRLSGYIDAYWLYAQKMKKEGRAPLVYLSHGYCHGNPKSCREGYIYHDGGLRWHFEIVKDGTFLGKKNLNDVMKTKWSRYVPPFRRYPDDKYWFLLKNLLKLKSPIMGKKAKRGYVLEVKKFWKEWGSKKIHSSAFRSLWGAPGVIKCAIKPPSKSDFVEEVEPFRELGLKTITKRGGIDEQTIEEYFLLKILRDGFRNKAVDAIWRQEEFTDKEEKRYRFDMAFRLVGGTCYAVEFKKGYGEDAPLQLANYIKKIKEKEEWGIKNPIPYVVCAIITPKLEKQMSRTFPKFKENIVEFLIEVKFT